MTRQRGGDTVSLHEVFLELVELKKKKVEKYLRILVENCEVWMSGG